MGNRESAKADETNLVIGLQGARDRFEDSVYGIAGVTLGQTGLSATADTNSFLFTGIPLHKVSAFLATLRRLIDCTPTIFAP